MSDTIMRLKISHTTRYRFDDPVTTGMQQLRLAPREGRTQQVLSWGVQIQGGLRELGFADHHGNAVDLVSFAKDCEELVISCAGEVEISDESHGVIGRHIGPVPLWLYKRVTPRTRAASAVKALLRAAEGDTVLARLHALMPLILEAVSYQTGTTDSSYTAEDALAAGQGVCQDHAHVMIACAREAGWPARYVSGYLMMAEQTQQTAMHAWAEVYVPDLGWVGFDPANVMCPDNRYVRVAIGLDYAEAAPVTGRRIGGEGERLDVAIEVAQQ